MFSPSLRSARPLDMPYSVLYDVGMTTTTETPTTDEVLVGMLTENTGRHMLDSGGAYGRNWERNQGTTIEDWIARPTATMDWDFGGFTLDVFHFLRDRLDFDPDMQDLFDEYAELPENRDEGWIVLMEGFPKWVEDNRPDLIDGSYGVGSYTVNSYNNDDALDQVIQYTAFTLGEHGDAIYGEFVLLQIHGGCDVRGGYTAPKVFRTGYDGATSLLDNAHGTLVCSPPDPDPNVVALPGLEGGGPSQHVWDTENAGYSWNDAGQAYPVRIPDLDNVKVEKVDSVEAIPPVSEDAEHTVYVVDGVGHCPLCRAPLSVHGWPAG